MTTGRKEYGITGRNLIEILFRLLRNRLRKTTKNISDDSRCQYRDSNLGTVENKPWLAVVRSLEAVGSGHNSQTLFPFLTNIGPTNWHFIILVLQ